MQDFFIVVLAVALAVAVIQQFFKHSRSSQRRVYWSCTAIGAVAGFLTVYPDWKKGLGMALVLSGVMTFLAYANTAYIKIGGKVYALTVQDSRPDAEDASVEKHSYTTVDVDVDPAPDSYSGLISATKMWWMMIPLLVISSGNIYAFASGEMEWWVAAIGMAFLVFLAVTTGLGDASWGYGIARGQHVQFGIAAVITAGVFAMLYLTAYQTAKRWPLRRTQSMEYRAHPRHRREAD